MIPAMTDMYYSPCRPTNPPDIGHALLGTDEAAIHGLIAHVQHRAPRIVLGPGATANSQDTDTNSQDEQREPHSRLLIMAPSYKCASPGLVRKALVANAL